MGLSLYMTFCMINLFEVYEFIYCNRIYFRSALLDDVGAAFRNDPWDSSPSTREMQSADDFTFQEIRQQQASVLQGVY